MKSYFKTKIRSYEDACKFLQQLNADNLIFHPEDDPADIINIAGEYTFNKREAKVINKRMDEVWAHMADPCEYILDTIYFNKFYKNN